METLSAIKSGCRSFLVLFVVLVLAGSAIGLIIYGLSTAKSAFSSSNWNTTTGEIIIAYVDKTGSENTGVSYTAKVEYTYVVDDKRYESDKIGFDEYVQDTLAEASAIIAPYEGEEFATVYYHPDDHANAVLEPGGSFLFLYTCGIGLFLLLFALAVFVAFLGGD